VRERAAAGEPAPCEARFFAAPPDGPRVAYAIRIGAPRRARDGEFACEVAFTHKAKPFEIYGVDTLQAMALSFTYLDAEVGRLLGLGWTFYFDETDPEPFDPRRAYFPARYADPP
jgi:hypothetical protein